MTNRNALPHVCGRCTSRWSGTSTCHCAAIDCHRTFSSPSAFDKHRKDGVCQDPASVGLVLTERVGYSVWGHPTNEATIEARRALGAGK